MTTGAWLQQDGEHSRRYVTEEPMEVRHSLFYDSATDTYTVSGRMPPNQGESQWHTFKIQTTCRGYQDAVPHDTVPAIGAP